MSNVTSAMTGNYIIISMENLYTHLIVFIKTWETSLNCTKYGVNIINEKMNKTTSKLFTFH